jgi:ligand-binding SRPBCC domain-containing protein
VKPAHSARSFHLRCWTRFLAPLDQVWDLKTDPETLLDEFRPWLSLKADDLDAARRLLRGEGLPGAVDTRLKLFGVLPGSRWPLRVEQLERHRHYLDTSENPLFDAWHHEHLFEPTADGVRYIDNVDFTPREGLPPMWIAQATRRLFVHRHRRAARHLPTDARATAVAMLREHLQS